MPKLIRDNSLTIVLMLLFAGSLVGQWLTGWAVENEEIRRHGGETLSRLAYLRDPMFISSVFENWESEFLQMAMYVVLTAFLFQRGSSESNDPDEAPRDPGRLEHLAPSAPARLRANPAGRWLYSHSLGLVLFALFLMSFVMHWIHSARTAAAEALDHGEQAPGVLAYLGEPQLWFESFQNWQSEFLSTAVLVVLSIFLRQRNSPESKPVAAPDSETGA